jgi:lipoteichoic acid synthase
MAKAWLMRGFALGAWNPLGAIAFETASGVLLMGLVDIIPPRRWYWLDLAMYSVISVLLFAITVYVHFYATLFDPSMMAMAGQLGSVSDVIAQLIKPEYVLFFVDIPVLAVWVVLLRKQAKRQRARSEEMAAGGRVRQPRRLVQPTHRSLRVAIVTGVALVIVIGQLFTALEVPSYVDGVAIAKSRGLTVAQAAVFLPHLSNESDDSSDNSIVAPGVQVASASTTAAPSPASLTPGGKMEAKVERIRGALEGSRIATFAPGAFRGKNVIIVQVEALDTIVMQKKIDGQEIMPNLNKLIDQSWYFPNTYSETGIGNTADAEFIVNSSLFAPRSQAAPVAYADRKVPALPRLIGALGYDTFTMHTNRVSYWNRKELYAALGFRRYYDAPWFHWTDIIAMGSSDEVLFSKAMKVLRADDASKTPFYAQFITLSSHTPFEFIPEKRRPMKTPPEYQGSLLGSYMSAESYSDMAIGQFIASLKKAKIWDKSIVIFYGDHTAMLDNQLDGTDAKAARALLGRDYGPADRQRIPLIIHLPGQTTGTIRTDTAGQIDIMPTVADLLGIDLTQVPHMGRSVFVDSNKLYPLNSYLPGGSFLNDTVLFMPGLGFDDGNAVTIADDASIKPTDREAADYKRMLALTKLSDKWVMSLPKRKDAGSLGDAWIPNMEARQNAAPLGAAQRGNGSGD